MDIQQLGNQLDELIEKEDSFSDHNLVAWKSLPATKCFLDFIVKTRFEVMSNHFMYREGSGSADSVAMQDCFAKGQHSALTDILLTLEEACIKKDEKEKDEKENE